jgi:hypothetical protein
MKPYRVKRGGKFIGNLLVVHKGKRVNLGTKDQNEGRRRIALLVKGQWPAEDVEAARAVKQALDPAVLPPDLASPPEVATPVPSPAVPPSTALPDQQTPAAPVVHPMDAVSATAAAEAGIEAEATAAMRDLGVDLGELGPKLPEYVGKGITVVSGQLARVPVRFIRGRWPEAPALPAEAELLRPVMGKCALVKLAQWGIDLEKLGPGAWFLVTFGICVTLQFAVALAASETATEEKKPVEGKPDLRPVS